MPIFIAFGAFFFVFSSRFLLVSTWGNRMPYWDEWADQGNHVLRPWVEGTFQWPSLFEPIMDHVYVTMRLVALGLFSLTNQWDPFVFGVFNCLVPAFSAAIVVFVLAREAIQSRSVWTLAIPTLLFALPLGWPNIAWPYTGHYQLLILFVVIALAGMVLGRTFSPFWICGAVASFVSIFTLASGWMLSATLVFISGLLAWGAPSTWRKQLAMALTGIVGLVVAAIVSPAPLERTSVDSIFGLLRSVWHYLSWPNYDGPLRWFGIASYLPLAALVVLYALRKNPVGLRCHQISALFIGAWGVAELLGLAYARGKTGYAHPRYFDLSAFALAGAFIAAFVLFFASKDKRPLAARVIFAGWLLLILSGSFRISAEAVTHWLPDWRRAALGQQELVAEYLALGQRKIFEDREMFEIPFPQPDFLAGILDNPKVRAILPAEVRTSLPFQVERNSGEGFLEGNNVPGTARGRQTFGPVWSSWRRQGEARGTLVSAPMETGFPYLLFEVCGRPGEGKLRMTLEEVGSGKKHRIAFPEQRVFKTDNWREYIVSSPKGPFRLVAEDGRPKGWFAFTPPRELSALGAWTRRLAAHAAWAFGFGAALFSVGLLVAASWSEGRAAAD